MHRNPSSQLGITLVEVLVALALMGLMSAMAYTGVSSMLTAQSTIEQASHNTTAMQQALAQWGHDWTSAAGVLMRPGPHFTGNAVRMVRGHSVGLGQVVAWKSGTTGLQRLAWPPAQSPDELSAQWDATWPWIQQSSTDTSPQLQEQAGLHAATFFIAYSNALSHLPTTLAPVPGVDDAVCNVSALTGQACAEIMQYRYMPAQETDVPVAPSFTY